MPRRYTPDGRALYNGKLPEDFSEKDVQRFLNTNRKDSTIMATTKTAPTTATETQAPAEAGVYVGEMAIEVTSVRAVEPQGARIGYINLKFGDGQNSITIPDFPIFNGETGLFVGNPSKQDAKNPRYFRDTATIKGDGMKSVINELARNAYIDKVQEMSDRAAAAKDMKIQPPRIADQLAKSGQEAARDNAARNAPQKEKAAPAHDDR
jgi:DNA-binding cell septation regulator SpoVG